MLLIVLSVSLKPPPLFNLSMQRYEVILIFKYKNPYFSNRKARFHIFYIIIFASNHIFYYRKKVLIYLITPYFFTFFVRLNPSEKIDKLSHKGAFNDTLKTIKTYMEQRLITLALLSSAMGASIPTMAQKAGKHLNKPNVIIILADDLGYGDIECYGAKNVHTPNINTVGHTLY